MALRPTARAASGLVASGHGLATSAGLAILREGGSAVDAAIAAAAVCAVTLPTATSIGGDVFALVFDASTREVTAYNGSGVAPRSLDPAAFAKGFPDRGASIATVPGCIRAWADMAEDHGRLGLERDLASAIRYAEDGFPVSGTLARGIAQFWPRLDADPECVRAYAPGGRLPRAGAMLAQPDLAASLREIATSGGEAFYTGALAERFASGIARIGGSITIEDLAYHATDRPKPLETTYRGLRFLGQPPVSQGHVLLEELAIADGLDLASEPALSAELIHQLTEIKKLAFADRDAYAGDPASVSFDAWRLLERDFVAARRQAIPARASDRTDAGLFAVPSTTTYLCVVDRDGNAVSLIESVYSSFGAAAMVPGTGILLNNRLTGFSLKAGSPNVLAPGKRPVHTLNAVMALDGSQLRFVYGTPGAQAQVQTNLQLAVSLVDHGLGVQEAIEQPRWYHEAGRALSVEARLAPETRRGLAAKGHELVVLPDWDAVTGGAQAIAIDENGTFSGGADPRREGMAAGY